MTTTTDKRILKLTYGQAISILIAVITATGGFYAYINGGNAKIDKLDAKVTAQIESINNKIEIVSLKQNNQFMITKNDRKRDSADRVNGFLDLKEELKEMRYVLLKNTNPYYIKSIGAN